MTALGSWGLDVYTLHYLVPDTFLASGGLHVFDNWCLTWILCSLYSAFRSDRSESVLVIQ